MTPKAAILSPKLCPSAPNRSPSDPKLKLYGAQSVCGGGALTPQPIAGRGRGHLLEVGVVIPGRGVAMRHCGAPKEGAWSLPNGRGC